MPKSKPESRTTRPAPGASPEHRPFPIVGIGASAGGLEAFRKLLGALPANTGMGFVLIQHLSPQYESFLAEILSKSTPMPVIEVTDGMRVLPNRVHVIPPNSTMVVRGGVLQLVKRDQEERPHLVIDHFFRSLAEDQKNDAIGVVLSGTGSDGGEGLKLIKGEGGISFAQSPESAKFGGMPQRAITIDHVDFILTPQQIAGELEKISNHSYLRLRHPSLGERDALPSAGEELERILGVVKHSTGVNFAQYKRTTVQRRVMRRMAVHKVEKLSDYYKILKDSRTEQTALYNDILINVTSFFRDPDVFDKLKSRVFPALVSKRRSGDPIRIWVAGCATGEEVYSIAIALLEFLGDRVSQFPIQIFGSDISDPCIAKARAGRYADGIADHVSSERLSRFFVRSEQGYIVSKAVRDCCVFARQDMVNDPPYSKLDLISCRNVLIYLEPTLQRKVLSLFKYAAKPNGFLVLGNSESPGTASGFFTAVEKKEKIYSVNSTGAHPRPSFTAATEPYDTFPVRSDVAAVPPTPLEAIERDADRLIATQHAPPSVVINEQLEVIQFRGDSTPYLAPPSGRPSFHVLKMARDGLAPGLKAVIEQVKDGSAAVSPVIKLRNDPAKRSIVIEAVPLRFSARGQLVLLLFKYAASGTASAGKRAAKVDSARDSAGRRDPSQRTRVLELNRELTDTKQYLESLNRDLESTNQDLQSANEEVRSANEELQSTNEELETAKEELQSGNEELTTVNDELQSRNTELDHVNNDLSNLLANIEMPILMISRDGYIRRITPAAQRTLSLIPSDVGRPIREIKSNFEAFGLELDLEQKVAEVVETMVGTETEVRDRKNHWFRLQVRPYRTLDNRIDGAVVVLVDINALKGSLGEINQARAEAEKARASAEAGNHAKDVFLATLSHELRTPLTTILSFSQLLQSEKLDGAKMKKGALMIEQAAHSQAQLINDLLDVSRIIMGKLSLEPRRLDPKAVLHSSVESVRPLADRKPVRLEVRLPDTDLEIQADPVRLKQIFLNLLTNAIKFSKTDGVVKVDLDSVAVRDGEFVRLRVRDSGKGISEKFLKELFDPFSQADSSSTRLHGGMGLGLAIVRNLAEAQGGSVQAESPGEGKGATFTVLFPAISRDLMSRDFGREREPAESSKRKISGTAKAASLQGLKLLLVDDDPGARESVSAVLISLGAEVYAVDSARDAIKMLPKFQPHVLVSDLAMPGEDGLSLLRRVRNLKSEALRRIPALALTAFAGPEDAMRTVEAGFQAYLTKPVDSQDLAAVISKLAKTRR